MYAIGKRKCAIARVWLSESNKPQVTVNKNKDSFLPLEEYFQHNEEWIEPILDVLSVRSLKCEIQVKGGGLNAQAEASTLAIKRALVSAKLASFKLTRDARIKERRKYGLKKARKAPQYSKR
jgi:small subunit ribosomal protein S9|uniref:30S ribosomal protein S9 n=2 Tax=Cyanidioschyzon merolae TaxID=45157 RepID=Q85FU1_CYAM1|nr:ribosomal protein S9 [Cyanidioschyzon merolae strain 10D]QFV17043.1 30S ribosomal protein S9 [Cyanidioschyzon merolae]QFV17216.1 30S ribosomal protein S9 [Cyanidioschyzon merolae]BAC76254.1 30S ribosomal protein S9 [Cyanidioschyzon merolae strain 10D]